MKYIIALTLLILFVCVALSHQQETLEDMVAEAFDEVMAESTASSCQVTASSLRVRSSYSTSSSTRGYLSRNQRVTKASTSTYYGSGLSWAKINYGGSTGYVAAKYLSCSSSPSTPTGGSGNKCAQSTKLKDSLKKIFSSEGKCQNWSSDSGNWMNGKLGYTCAGIIPSVGYNNRNFFSYAQSSCSSKPAHLFVKCAWDKSNSKFKDGSAKIYEKQYAIAGGCANLKQPAYYVCFDIAVNSGPGRSKQFIRETNAGSLNEFDAATKLNEKHRDFYIRISKPGTKNHKFRKGWLARADHRAAYIRSCRA